MKKFKLISASGLIISLVFTACNESSKEKDAASNFSPAGSSNADSGSLKNAARDSAAALNDTVTTAPSLSDEKKNNPDITK